MRQSPEMRRITNRLIAIQVASIVTMAALVFAIARFASG